LRPNELLFKRNSFQIFMVYRDSDDASSGVNESQLAEKFRLEFQHICVEVKHHVCAARSHHENQNKNNWLV
jgi:hypothetical protein